MSKKGFSESQFLLIATLAVFSLFVLGLFYPDQFWAFHYPSFLPDAFGGILVFGSIAFAIYGLNKGVWTKLDTPVKADSDSLWRYGVPILAAFIFYQFPIAVDLYGDAYFILPRNGAYIEVYEQRFFDNLFSFDLFDTKIGTSTTVALVCSGSYYLGMTLDEVFRWLGLICGAGYIFFMLGIIKRLTNRRDLRLLLTIVVVGTPLVQVFCRHYEVYAPTYMLLAAFWYVVVRYYKNPSTKKIWVLAALIILNIKFHITGLVLVPITLLIVIYHTRGLKDLKEGISWRSIFRKAVVPMYALGAFVYVFVTKSVFGPRKFEADTFLDAIFLPISSKDPAPLDRYNLFSISHIFDYFSMLFVWSAAAILVIAVLFFLRKETLKLKHPLVQITGYAMLLYLPLFFVFNPLYSMPGDWDIMGIPGITLIVFVIALVGTRAEISGKKKESPSIIARLFAPIIGLTLLGLTSVVVNADVESEGKRLVSMGKYQYKTYYLASSSYVLEGLKMLSDQNERAQLHEQVIAELKPFAIKEVDPEYAQIVSVLGVHYRDDKKDYEKGLSLLNEAYEYAPYLGTNVYQLLISHFYSKNFEQANTYVPLLVGLNYPNPEKALRVGIHVAIEAGDYEAAEEYCRSFLEQWPQEEFIQKVLYILQTAEDKRDAVSLFRQS